MSDSNDHDANSNNLPSGTEAAVIPLGSAKKGDVGNTHGRILGSNKHHAAYRLKS